MDLGRNVTVSGGFAVQEGLDWLLDIPKGDDGLAAPQYGTLFLRWRDFDAFWKSWPPTQRWSRFILPKSMSGSRGSPGFLTRMATSSRSGNP